ncbi:hypothetical protein AUJ87_01780 [Candidatus Gracilibacteria bacterium CG1_02_38_174]|nr:MAG: hypothetical protein AUJ87_01780 [Candidatus Gracilibacteria bacterium CG1_02_38_174]
MNNYSDITIAITSCGRYSLLKKTIHSIEQNIDLRDIKKIITEDSKNPKHKEKIIKAQRNGFLIGWDVIFTNGKRQHGALIDLYNKINTKYVFHCEEDWYFRKVNFNFLDISKSILEKYPDIGIVQLRDLITDGGLKRENITEKQCYNELFSSQILIHDNLQFVYFRNDEDGNIFKGFSYNPGLRRTDEMKKIMFGYEDTVDEVAIGNRYMKTGLRSVNIIPGIVVHIGNNLLSTKFVDFFKDGFFFGLRIVLLTSLKYRTKLLKTYIGNKKLKFYWYLDSIYWSRWCMDTLAGIGRKMNTKPVSLSLLQNIENIKTMNIPHSWFTEDKLSGISGVARLKNGDDFLEQTLESHIPFLDELILIDNLSTDSTRLICEKFAKKYPQKVKVYEYPYNVFQIGTHKVDPRSIHSFAYYSNWCVSQTKYRYIMRVDDDNILIPEKFNQIRTYILKYKPNKNLMYWGYNLLKKDNQIGICKNDPYSGKLADHGIYPVSEFTYYIQSEFGELLRDNLLYKRFGMSFIHLKYLKKDLGFINCSTDVGKIKKQLVINSDIINPEDTKDGKKIYSIISSISSL